MVGQKFGIVAMHLHVCNYVGLVSLKRFLRIFFPLGKNVFSPALHLLVGSREQQRYMWGWRVPIDHGSRGKWGNPLSPDRGWECRCADICHGCRCVQVWGVNMCAHVGLEVFVTGPRRVF